MTNKIDEVCAGVHDIYYKFKEYMEQWYYEDDEIMELKGDNFVGTGKFEHTFCSQKIFGYEAIQRIEEFIKVNPEVRIVDVDDDFFTGSVIVLIPHPTMGVTAIYVPQNADNREFFFYPYAIKGLVETMTEMQEFIKDKK